MIGLQKGYLVNKKRDGYGRMVYSDGRLCEGNWLNNKRNGEGKMTYCNGIVYQGHWLNGQQWNNINDNFLKLPYFFNNDKIVEFSFPENK